ncbi:MAG: hypothetical protein MK538_10835 [Planctomycetes bacterium]|nr:hypothetical protein [Planctomycetota bacterium]
MALKMRRLGWRLITVAFALCVISSSVVLAQENAVSGIEDYLSDPNLAEDVSSEYITLDVRDKDLKEILKFISRRVGVNVIADLEVKEKVTIQLESVEWREALQVIAKQTRCEVLEVSDRLIRFTQPPAISMEFQDADIKVVLELLAKQAGANIMMASDIQGQISLSLREVPWREALDAIVKTAGYVVVKEETDSVKEILRVVPPDSLKEQLETRHFQLRFVRPDDPYLAIITGLEAYTVSQFSGTGTSASFEGAGSGDGAGNFSLVSALQKVVSKGGSLDHDPHTNTIIVKDTKPKLDEIAHIIRLVDVKPAQVYVEVKFISTANADILERGVKFDVEGTPERDGFQLAAFGAEPNPLATDPLFQFGGTFPFDIGEPKDIIDDFQALGVLDFRGTRALLRLIDDDENSRVVQEPALTMVDNVPGTIFVGETIPFAVQKVNLDQNGNATVSIDENKRSPINVGFTLYMVPHVISGTDMIRMSVIPRVSTLTGTTSDVAGFDRFEFTQEATGANTFIDLPREASQTVVTSLRVHDGHTAVLGGLQTERKQEIESKIPVLSSIPVVGNFLTWRRKANDIESLIIMITPHILKNVRQDENRFKKALKKHQKRDFFFRKYEDDSAPPKRPEGAGVNGAEAAD